MTGDDRLTWSVLPGAEDYRKRVVIYSVSILSGVVTGLVSNNLLMGFVASLVILGSTAEYWLGSKFSFEPVEAKARRGWSFQGIRWEDVETVFLSPNRIKLSPLEVKLTEEGTPEKRSKLEAFRGIEVEVTPENRERVIEFLKGKVKADARILGD